MIKLLQIFWLFMFSFSSLAAIPSEGAYLGLLGGPSYLSRLKFNGPAYVNHAPVELSYEIGLLISPQIGYRYDKFRFELQTIFNRNQYKVLSVANYNLNRRPIGLGLRLSGHTQFIAPLINLIYEWYPEDKELSLVPYGGIGIGAAFFHNDFGIWYNDTSLYYDKINRTAPLLQAIIGVNYLINDRLALGLDYRYLTTPFYHAVGNRLHLDTVNTVITYSF